MLWSRRPWIVMVPLWAAYDFVYNLYNVYNVRMTALSGLDCIAILLPALIAFCYMQMTSMPLRCRHSGVDGLIDWSPGSLLVS